MNQTLACPDLQNLARRDLGQLPREQIDELVAHLHQCVTCRWRLQSLRSGTQRNESSAIVQQLIERLEKLPTSPADAATLPPADAKPPSLAPDVAVILTPPQQPDEIGRLGSYRVLKMLGRGGMGVVFLAEDSKLQRKVALKAVLPGNPQGTISDSARERFLREARLAAQLKNDHIVTIYQVDEEHGVPYLAMEFLEGKAMDDWLKSGRKPTLQQVISIGRQIALGLAAAHERGMVHRDIKPGNLWLDSSAGGRVKILDFGLARPVDSDMHLTQSGAIVGTPAYMAPEQARSETIDGRADLFSLGVVLYRLSTGQMPFKGHDIMSTLMSIATDTPKPVREINAAVPEPLAELIGQLLEKDPILRPAGARVVAERLLRLSKQLAMPSGAGKAVSPTEPAASGSSPQTEQTQSLPAVSAIAPPMEQSSLTRTTTLPIQSAPRKSRRVLLIGIIGLTAALAVAAVLLTAMVFFFQTPKGTVRVEIADDSIEAVLTKNGATFKGADKGGEITVAPGEQTLKIKRGDLEFETDKFVLKKGEMVVLKVELLPGKVQVVQDGKVIGERGLPVSVVGDPDRKAAEWVLSVGGKVYIHGSDEQIKAIGDLPKDEIRLTEVLLEGIEVITDEGLAHFKDCKGLTVLGLESTAVTDRGLVHLKELKQLTHLGLWGTSVSDAGLLHLKELTSLRYIHLAQTQITDAGLVHLKALNNLIDLRLWGTKVTAKGLADLHAAVPACKIAHDGGVLEPIKTDRTVAEQVLALTGSVHILEGKQDVNAVAELPKEQFQISGISLGGKELPKEGLGLLRHCKALNEVILNNTAVTDAQLSALKDCSRLAVLNLNSTQISDAGLANLRECKEITQLYMNGTKITNQGLVHLKALKSLDYIDVTGTQLSDEGTIHLKELTSLTRLWLTGTKITDKSLAQLTGLRRLTVLDVSRTAVTAKGMADFHAALPGCKIHHDGGVIEPKAEDEVDRKAAEWVLSLGGFVQVNGQDRDIKQAADLPRERFTLKVVVLSGNKQVTDAGLEHFKDCNRLTSLHLSATGVTDVGLAYFKDCKNLTYFNMGSTKVTDAGLAHFKNCKNLTHLGMSNTKVTDAGLEHFKDCKRLTHLDLFYTRVTDVGLAYFKDCKNLTFLSVGLTAVTDAGLAHFNDCKNLTHLGVTNTKVTVAGMVHFKDCKNLTHLDLCGTKMTDAGLVHLKDLTSLKSLDLKKTQVTARAAVNFQTAVPGCRIELDGGVIEPKK